MPRGINSATITALEGDSFNLVTLIEFQFSTPVYITDTGRDVVTLGNTYTSSSHFVGVDAPQETQELRVNTVNITLSGVDPSFNAIFLAEQSNVSTYLDVVVKIHRAVLNNTGSVVGAPFMIFQGLITGYSLNDSRDDSTLTVECASHWKDFEKEHGRRTNNNSQKVHFPNDKGFEFAAKSVKDMRWGKK